MAYVQGNNILKVDLVNNSVVVDQEFVEGSTNAQSGIAVQ